MEIDREALNKKLFPVKKEDYGPEYDAHLLEQYKLALEMADRISERRMTANNFFLGINTALIAAGGIIIKGLSMMAATTWAIIVMIVGLLLCYYWRRMILAFKNLNTAKFIVAHTMEARLPAAPYDAEWIALGEGKDPKRYIPFTNTELLIPKLFGAFYIVIALTIIIWAVTVYIKTGSLQGTFPAGISLN